MTLTETVNGVTATSASELPAVNEITADDLNYWGAQVFIPSAFTTGDKMEVSFYIWNSAQSQFERVYNRILTGATSYTETAILIPPCQTKRYRLTYKRTSGTDRSFAWSIFKQTG